jgi:hypothetical protein
LWNADPHDELTPQGLQIVGLDSAGASNLEIAT